MSTLVEDPGIPLVGRNGGFQMYGHDGRPTRPERKYDNVGYRLAKRKCLYQRRKVICDFALGFAMLGIILMVVETELFMAGVYDKSETASLLIKSCITISTVTLLGFVVWYHILDIKLFMCDNSVEDWRLAMSNKRIWKIIVELAIYAIHPFPGNHDISFESKLPPTECGVQYDHQDPTSNPTVTIMVPVDVILSMPMFMRFYLICRVMMLHSKLFTDASSQSLGALNRIHFNFKFIFKSMMSLSPEYVLTVLMLTVCITASWLIRACEMYHDPIHRDFFNSMWLIVITFLSVGYGDIVPNSHCGRGVAILTGIFGAFCTALVVAVLARKLELSRAEKYVHNFVIDVELDKRYKHAAANILKAGWFVYKNRKLGKSRLVRRYQRKLLKAIHSIRDVKQRQRHLADNSVTILELYKSQNNLHHTANSLEMRHLDLHQRVEAVEEKLSSIDSKLDLLVAAVTGKR